MSTNAGFRPEELARRTFQTATAKAINQHAEAINAMNDRARVSREFAADLSMRIDILESRTAAWPVTLWGRLRWLLTGA